MTTITTRVPILRRIAAAVAAAFCVSLGGLAVSELLFYQGVNTQLFAIFSSFFPSAILIFVLLSVFGAIGIYRVWYFRLIGGILAAVVGTMLGSLVSVVLAGTALPPDVVVKLLQTLLGLNLPVTLTTIILTLTAAPAIHRWIMSASDGAPRRIAFVRAPAETLAAGQVTHIERTAVDLDLANTQWDSYVRTLSDEGWNIVEVETADAHADSVFIEDTMVVFGDLAVIGSPGSASRIGEIVVAEAAARDLGLDIRHITLPGTLDGGDVLKVGTTIYVGRGGRTNAEGIRQLRALVSPLGYAVVTVPVTKALHLKSAVTALPDGTVIGYAPVVDDTTVFGRFLAVPEPEGVAVVVLADDTVLMSSSAPLSAALIENLGYRVITTDISEFEKLEGCVTCLSVRIR